MRASRGLLTAVLVLAAFFCVVSFVQAVSSHPLIGKPAPSITLNLLEGGTLNLDELKGKIVVLDFWATWCPPCRESIPAYAKISEEYKAKDVVFYGINVGVLFGTEHFDEDPSRLRAFQKKAGVEFPVALDTTLDASTKYLVDSLPQCVIIGKNGIVEAVHVGLTADFKRDFRQEIDKLASGKSLVRETVPPAEAPKK